MILPPNDKPAGDLSGGDSALLPLINVVFLLLLFILVGGRIAVREDALPASTSEAARDPSALVVTVSDAHRIAIDGQPVAGDVAGALATRLAGERRGGDARPSVIVHIDRELDVSALDPVIVALRSLRVQQLQIATQPPP